MNIIFKIIQQQELIEIILKKNKIIHIDGEINKIIDIINDKTTYDDILKLVKDSQTK